MLPFPAAGSPHSLSPNGNLSKDLAVAPAMTHGLLPRQGDGVRHTRECPYASRQQEAPERLALPFASAPKLYEVSACVQTIRAATVQILLLLPSWPHSIAGQCSSTPILLSAGCTLPGRGNQPGCTLPGRGNQPTPCDCAGQARQAAHLCGAAVAGTELKVFRSSQDSQRLWVGLLGATQWDFLHKAGGHLMIFSFLVLCEWSGARRTADDCGYVHGCPKRGTARLA